MLDLWLKSPVKFAFLLTMVPKPLLGVTGQLGAGEPNRGRPWDMIELPPLIKADPEKLSKNERALSHIFYRPQWAYTKNRKNFKLFRLYLVSSL